MNKLDVITITLLAAASAGATLAWRYHHLALRMRRVQGVVVDQVTAGEESAARFYYAVVEFVDAGGQRIRFTDRFGHGGHPLFPVGSAVSVDYALSDPAQAAIHSVAMSRTVGVGALILGTLLLVVGLWPL